VQQRHAALGTEPSERGLQLQRFSERLLHEPLDDILAPWPQRSSPEPSGESLHAGEPDSRDFTRFSIENADSGVTEDVSKLRRLAQLVIVISEDGHDGNRDRAENTSQTSRFFGVAVIRQVSAQGEDVGTLRDFREERA
jgi:hypothetical protein